MIWMLFGLGAFLTLWLALSIAGTVYAVPVGIALACIGVLALLFEDRPLR